MVKITFQYRDEYSHGEWRTQQCEVDWLKECIEIYGLNECEYKILSIENLTKC